MKKLQQFDKQLSKIVAPLLEKQYSFVRVKPRVFLRQTLKGNTKFIQIIDFQIGIKHLTGKFTVNLGVFNKELGNESQEDIPESSITIADCMLDMTIRLNKFYTPPVSLLKKLFRGRPSDIEYWWTQYESKQKMGNTLSAVADLLQAHAFLWLEEKSSPEAFRQAHEQNRTRRELIEQLHP